MITSVSWHWNCLLGHLPAVIKSVVVLTKSKRCTVENPTSNQETTTYTNSTTGRNWRECHWWRPVLNPRMIKMRENPNEQYISADPGLRQGRGGAWDHRRCGSCLSWTLATPNAAGKSHHKATAMAQEHPTAAAMASFIGVQGCRLPGLKPSKPSNSSKSLPNSAGKRYPNKPNTRHARRQKPPQGHSNGSRAPHGRSNGFL